MIYYLAQESRLAETSPVFLVTSVLSFAMPAVTRKIAPEVKMLITSLSKKDVVIAGIGNEMMLENVRKVHTIAGKLFEDQTKIAPITLMVSKPYKDMNVIPQN